MADSDTLEQHLNQATKILQVLRQEIGKAMVGQQVIVDQVLIALLASGHVLVEGVPGLGKTLLVKSLAKTFDGQFARIQFTPDLMPSDITGHTLYDATAGQFTTRKGPIFCNLLLADEINRAPAKTQAALLEVMQEMQVTIEGQTHALSAPFMVLATQNPIEQEGTYPLPEAQLDRFLLKVRIVYPSQEEELALVRQITGGTVGERLQVDNVTRVITPLVVNNLQRLTAQLTVDERVLDYAIRIVRATRDFASLRAGAGPRGGIAVIRAARAAALLAGRGFVTPADVKQVALPALRHRVIPTPEAEIEGETADAILNALLAQVAAPRE
jgi:MoxR-like ATPase